MNWGIFSIALICWTIGMFVFGQQAEASGRKRRNRNAHILYVEETDGQGWFWAIGLCIAAVTMFTLAVYADKPLQHAARIHQQISSQHADGYK